MSTDTDAAILLAEEDDSTRAFLGRELSADGYRGLTAGGRAKALAVLSTENPDPIVVDINGDTLSLIDAVREGEGIAGRADPAPPVVVLSGDADRLQRIRMLERGGDDVVKKPFSYPELRARIAAVLRRSQGPRAARILHSGPLTIDIAAREARLDGRPLSLTATEYELLVALASDPHRVFTREELLQGVWGFRSKGRTRTLDCHASRSQARRCDSRHADRSSKGRLVGAGDAAARAGCGVAGGLDRAPIANTRPGRRRPPPTTKPGAESDSSSSTRCQRRRGLVPTALARCACGAISCSYLRADDCLEPGQLQLQAAYRCACPRRGAPPRRSPGFLAPRPRASV